MKENLVLKAYEIAKERYAAIGVNTDEVLDKLQKVQISLHCWQTDDVVGFESGSALSGGIQTTGNYPGKARNIDEVRADLVEAMSLIPSKHRVNLHEIYGDFGGKFVDRDQCEPAHFESWMQWAAVSNSTSTHLLFHTRNRAIFLSRIPTKESVIFGLSIPNVVVLLPKRWVNAREIPVS